MLKTLKIVALYFLALGLGMSCSTKERCDRLNSIMEFQRLGDDSDDCGFVLTLDLADEWRALRPINLEDFNITPEPWLRVCGSFIERPDLDSPCEFAETVEILSIAVY